MLFKQFTLAGVFFTFPILSCKNNSTLQLFQLDRIFIFIVSKTSDLHLITIKK